MITEWQTIELCIQQHHLTDIDCKYDLSWSSRMGWFLNAVIVEGNEKCQLTIKSDGSVKNEHGDAIQAPLAEAIYGAAAVKFERDRDALIEQYGLEDSKPYKPSPPIFGVGFRGGKYAA